MLWYDLEELLEEKQYGEAPEIHVDLNYAVRTFSEVEAEYLEIYNKYQKISG